MSKNELPGPGLVHVEETTKRPNAVVLQRKTVTLTVFALLLGTFGGAALFNERVQDAQQAAAETERQSEENGLVVQEIQNTATANNALVEAGVDCLIALQGEAARNAEAANAQAAAAHGYTVEPPLPDQVTIPTQVQLDFIASACTRFFDAQAEADPASPP